MKQSTVAICFAVILFLAAMLVYLPSSPSPPGPEVQDAMTICALRSAAIGFKSVFSFTPQGNNSQIMKQLLGDNAKHIVFITTNNFTFDKSGNILSSNGKPFLFTHSTSGDVIIQVSSN